MRAINLAAPDADSSSSSSSSLDDMLTVLMLAAYASSGLRGANLWRWHGIISCAGTCPWQPVRDFA